MQERSKIDGKCTGNSETAENKPDLTIENVYSML